MQYNYHEIEQKIIKALRNAKIKAEFCNKHKGFSYDVLRFHILSSLRISSKRLYIVGDILSAEFGYPVKIRKEDDYLNVEIPDSYPRNVYFDSAAESLKKSSCLLPILLGRKENGHKAIIDLYYMPHLLIAGSGNSGQLTMLDNVIASLTAKRTQEEVRFILADISGNDFERYSDSPYLHGTLIKDDKTLLKSLEWICDEIMRRYCLLAGAEVRNIVEYNKKADDKLPYLVLVVKDLNDVMNCCSHDFETYMQKIAAKARAAGVHIILSSTIVSCDTITATILNNIPACVAFRTDSSIQSRVLINTTDAMYLYYPEDFMFLSRYGKEPIRMKAFVANKPEEGEKHER